MSSNENPPARREGPQRASYTVEQILVGIVMGLIALITFANVLVRYLSSQSFAATEEFSIALLIVLAFLGSAVAFSYERHIQVSFFVDRLPPRPRRVLGRLSFAVTVGLFAFIAFYGGRLTWDQYRFEETSPALGVPQWWYTVWMPVLAVALVVRLLHGQLRKRS